MNLMTLEREYREALPDADRLCRALEEQINQLVRRNGINLAVPLEHRVKTWTSIAEKLERKAKDIESVLSLPDLVGCRLIVLFRRDVDAAINLITKTFRISESEDTRQRLDDDQFGYQSHHFVAQLPSEWLAVPSMRPFSRFRFEIQLRTMSQHLWAAASHKLQYKHESAVPPPVRRSINRVAALLETADLEFERVLSERDAYIDGVPVEDAERGLDVDVLAKVLDDILPNQNKSQNEEYASLLGDLAAFGIDTVHKLRSLLNVHSDAVAKQERRAVAGGEEAGFVTSPHRFQRGVFYSHVGMVRVALSSEFGEKWKRYIRKKSEAEDQILLD